MESTKIRRRLSYHRLRTGLTGTRNINQSHQGDRRRFRPIENDHPPHRRRHLPDTNPCHQCPKATEDGPLERRHPPRTANHHQLSDHNTYLHGLNGRRAIGTGSGSMPRQDTGVFPVTGIRCGVSHNKYSSPLPPRWHRHRRHRPGRRQDRGAAKPSGSMPRNGSDRAGRWRPSGVVGQAEPVSILMAAPDPASACSATRSRDQAVSRAAYHSSSPRAQPMIGSRLSRRCPQTRDPPMRAVGSAQSLIA